MARDSASQRSSSVSACAWLVIGLLLCLFVPGCGGCTPQDPAEIAKAKKEREEAEKKKKLEKPKADYESADLVIEPGESKATSNVVKPGHWVAASKAFKANNNDLPAADIFSAPVDLAGNPLEAEHTPFRLVMSRPVSLSKGQTKHFEFLYYIPRKVEGMATTVRLQNILTARGGGRELYHPGDEPTLRMPAYQFHLLVLASDPDRYGFLKRLDTIN
ncbi:MAG TPA: hypothetical protein VL096_09690, partial [Pirellulaceae bacterium]|nr:hypothetical protein [Pirellulaceae bacterium]